jgi:hypothetical protein
MQPIPLSNIPEDHFPQAQRAGGDGFRYVVYGVSLHSEIPLELPQSNGSGIAQIELRTASPENFREITRNLNLVARDNWYYYAHLENGSSYVRWLGLGEFLVSADGGRIVCTRAPEAPVESFQVYLLGQALSFALVKSGLEPFHATAIVSGDGAVVLLGDCGYGKSTLAASFLRAGDRLLTDDLLLLRPAKAGGLEACPGPPRIKLFSNMARRFLRSAARTVPMNALTDKHVIPLTAAQYCTRALPLRGIYALAAPGETHRRSPITIETLPSREAFLALVANTFNRYIAEPDRLQRQLAEVSRVLRMMPVKKLSYPRVLARLPEVRAAILADCAAPVEKFAEKLA